MNGILLVDKESGWTSNDVVAKLKGILHQRRIGHSGTLDPMATGLLVVFTGRATRAVSFAESQDKRYIASLRLGVSTDTQDITGTVLSRRPCNIDSAALAAAINQFSGEILQLPPMYSAIKVNGRRLYDIARKGGEVERKPRPVTIHSLSVIGRDGEDYILDISCSKGTYIRTLCNDIGEALGCGGCMSALRRISAGSFKIENSVKLGDIQRLADEGKADSLLIPVDSLFSEYPICTVGADAERYIRCGTETASPLPDGKYRVYSQAGEFLMLGLVRDGKMSTIKSFFEV